MSHLLMRRATPECFVTHELLERHLGYEVSMSEFEGMEQLPYVAVEAGSMSHGLLVDPEPSTRQPRESKDRV